MNQLADTRDFLGRWKAAAMTFGPFCLGIDPSAELLRLWDLEDNVDGLARFCETVGGWVSGRVAAIKPQIAFFERFGSAGMGVLEGFVSEVRRQGNLTIIDAKRGDIGTTAAAYGDAYFASTSSLRTDGLTVHPYLGVSALDAIFSRAHLVGGAVFVVVASSNPDGLMLQAATTSDSQQVAVAIARDVRRWNEGANAKVGGAVLGATRAGALDSILEALGSAPVLMPGIGAQGADFGDLTRLSGHERIIPSASRSVLTAGRDRDAFMRTIDAHIERARAALV